jgi:hypothetical protein
MPDQNHARHSVVLSETILNVLTVEPIQFIDLTDRINQHLMAAQPFGPVGKAKTISSSAAAAMANSASTRMRSIRKQRTVAVTESPLVPSSIRGALDIKADGNRSAPDDVLKPRKRSSVIVSGDSYELPSPNRATFLIFSEETSQNQLREVGHTNLELTTLMTVTDDN